MTLKGQKYLIWVIYLSQIFVHFVLRQDVLQIGTFHFPMGQNVKFYFFKCLKNFKFQNSSNKVMC